LSTLPTLEAARRRFQSSPLLQRLAGGAFWSLMGAVISHLLTLTSSVVVARLLGREGFGELGMVQSTVGMFQVFAGLGLGMTATKYIAELRATDPERAGRIIGLSGVVAATTGALLAGLLAIFAPWFSARVLSAPHLTGMLRLGSLILVFSAVNGAQTGVIAGFEAFKSLARIQFIAAILFFPIMVGGVYFFGLMGAVGALVLVSACNWCLFALTLRAEARRAGVPISFRGIGSELGVLLTFSIPAALSGVMVGPVNWACNALVVNQPGGYAEMGLFNAANQWRNAILFLPRAVEAITLPVLSSLYGGRDHRRYRKVLGYNVAFNAVTALLAGAGVALFSGIIMSMYGTGFSTGRSALIILSFSAALMAAASILGQSIISRGMMWAGFVLNLLWAVAVIGLTFALRGQGASGLAFANLIAYGFHLATVGAFVWLKALPTAARPAAEHGG